MTTQHPEYLGQVTHARREELKLSKQAVHASVGLNPLTLSKIENGQAGQIRKDTLSRLDRAMQWKEGSAEAAFVWRRPPVEASKSPATAPSVLYIPFPPELIQSTVKLAETVADAVGGDERLAGIVSNMDTVADRILRAWTIADIERQKFEGTLSSATIEMLLGHYMRRTPQAPTVQDADELLYLRWLLGRLPESVPADQEERFVQRWARVQQMFSVPGRITE
ncbi:helix-turn-helix transcriptional regulator [Nocardia uniformis]|uniref:Helix-turn-helix transcriptional regulator n=1 Tax=Nocardia uniformis TaxID=53432 RepID=A0A849CEB2_9NOCA|nr:helix-turn-helix transcriptional regulator [Nocardia uniformis]NNH73649.1 helix-turn-helix transcriptional regulator [Nocardia uniformis]